MYRSEFHFISSFFSYISIRNKHKHTKIEQFLIFIFFIFNFLFRIVNALKVANEAPKESDYDALSMLRQNSKKKFTDEELEEEKIPEEKTEEKDQDEVEESIEKKEYHSGTDSESEEPLVKSKKPKIVSNVIIKKSKKEEEVKEEKSKLEEGQSESHRRQTILLSATLTQSVEKLAGMTLKNPVFIDAAKDNIDSIDGDTNLVNEDLIVPQSVVQTYVVTPPKLRMVTLCAYIAGKCQVCKNQLTNLIHNFVSKI